MFYLYDINKYMLIVKNNFTPLKNKKIQEGTGIFTTVSKEVEPTISIEQVPEKVVFHEVSEYKPDKETLKFINKRQEEVNIDEDLRKIGVIPNQTISCPDYKQVNLPISDEEVVQGLKMPITSSFRWLAEFALYLLKQTHQVLKQIHGKITRVATS